MTFVSTVAKKATVVLLSALVVASTPLFAATPALAVTQDEVDAALASFTAAKEEALAAAEAYYEALDAYDAALAAMEEAQEQIDETTAKIEDNQAKLASRAVAMYRSGSPTMLDVFVGSSSFTEFATLWDLLNELNENDARLVQENKELRAEQQAAYEEYAEQERIAAEQLEASKIAKEESEATAAAVEEEYNSLSEELLEQIAAAQEQASSTTDESSGSSSSSSGGYVNNGGVSPCNVELALSLVGCDYEYGATGPDKFDCSGLCYYCGAPYRSSASLYANATSRLPVSEAQPGDVLWRSGHVGIYIGNNQYVHASDYGVGVIVSSGATSAFTYALRF